MMNQTQEPLLLSDTDLETITGGAPISYRDFVGNIVIYTDVAKSSRYEPASANGGIWKTNNFYTVDG